jgi:hypothetical protein
MGIGVNTVDLDGTNDIEAGLLKPQRHATSPRKEVDNHWSSVAVKA